MGSMRETVRGFDEPRMKRSCAAASYASAAAAIRVDTLIVVVGEP